MSNNKAREDETYQVGTRINHINRVAETRETDLCVCCLVIILESDWRTGLLALPGMYVLFRQIMSWDSADALFKMGSLSGKRISLIRFENGRSGYCSRTGLL